MRFRLRILGPLVAVCCVSTTDQARAVPGERVRAAAAAGDHLLCRYDGGSVGAWDLTTRAYAKDAATRLARKGLACLAADGEKPWAADGSAVYRWSTADGAWGKAAGFDAGGEGLAGLVPVGGSPILVFPSQAAGPLTGRTFQVPKLPGAAHGPPLRILAAHGTESRPWVGTGRGEWGGTLLGLDPKAGAWVHGRDALHDVTGITHSARGEVVVSGSMSHFAANTRIRVHKSDAAVKAGHPELDGKSYQCVTDSRHDDTLDAVESEDRVVVKDGEPSKVVGLDGQLFERERDAIGVAPGVLALVPTGPKTVVILPERGEPWRVREGGLTRLRKP